MLADSLKVQFQIQHHCDFGQALYVIGSLYQLGKWKIKSAFRLTWSEVKSCLLSLESTLIFPGPQLEWYD